MTSGGVSHEEVPLFTPGAANVSSPPPPVTWHGVLFTLSLVLKLSCPGGNVMTLHCMARHDMTLHCITCHDMT